MGSIPIPLGTILKYNYVILELLIKILTIFSEMGFKNINNTTKVYVQAQKNLDTEVSMPLHTQKNHKLQKMNFDSGTESANVIDSFLSKSVALTPGSASFPGSQNHLIIALMQ